MPQTVIQKTGQPVAVAGQLSDSMDTIDVVSRFSQEASAAIQFGCAVQSGTVRSGVKNMATSNDNIEGVSVFGYNHVPGSSGDIDTTNKGLKPNAGLKILRKGRIWVLIDPSITLITPYADRPFARYSANGGNTVLGAFSNVSDGGHNTDLSRIGVFTSGLFTAADGTSLIAECEFDFTNRNS